MEMGFQEEVYIRPSAAWRKFFKSVEIFIGDTKVMFSYIYLDSIFKKFEISQILKVFGQSEVFENFSKFLSKILDFLRISIFF